MLEALRIAVIGYRTSDFFPGFIEVVTFTDLRTGEKHNVLVDAEYLDESVYTPSPINLNVWDAFVDDTLVGYTRKPLEVVDPRATHLIHNTK